MGRPLRLDFEGAWHHTMNRGLRKQPIFGNDMDRRRFLDLLGDVETRYGVQTHAYVLMGNHYHLLLHAPRGGLSAAMRHLNGSYSRGYNRIHELDGPLFRGRFRSLTVESERYYVELIRYIHRNPVAAGLCRNAADYPWSSHRSYLGLVRPPAFLHVGSVLSRFGFDRARFGAFVDAASSEVGLEIEGAIHERVPALGTEDRIQTFIDQATADVETRASARRVPSPAPLHDLETWVATKLAISIDELVVHSQGRANAALAVLLTLAHRGGYATLVELADRYGYANYYGVSSQIRRCEQRAERDVRLRQLLDDGLERASAA